MIKLAAAKNLLFWNNNFIVFYRYIIAYIYVIAFREDNLLGFFVIAGRG